MLETSMVNIILYKKINVNDSSLHSTPRIAQIVQIAICIIKRRRQYRPFGSEASGSKRFNTPQTRRNWLRPICAGVLPPWRDSLRRAFVRDAGPGLCPGV